MRDLRQLRGYAGRLLRHSGYALAKGAGLPALRPEATATGRHEMVFPLATWSPWLTDPGFRAVYEQARGNTLVDELRCWELWTLVHELRGVPGAVVEVGVWRGGTGAVLAAAAARAGIAEPVVLCDTFTGVPKAAGVDVRYEGGEHADTSVPTVEALMRGLGLTNYELAVGIFPDESGAPYRDRLFRLAHVDVDVYESARDVVDFVWPRMPVGAMVVFDDYGFASTPGITAYVDDQRALPDRAVLHNLNGHGILVKLAAG